MDDTDDICRVCRSEGSSENPLFYPCVCQGTIKFVHQDCLVQWLKYSKKETCELCKHPFTFMPIYSPDMPKKIPLTVIIFGIGKSIYKLFKNWFHYTLVLVTWLIMVPFSAARIYSAIFNTNPSALLPSSIFQLDGKQMIWSYMQGIFIVILGLCLFMSIVWLKEQILTTQEISDWLANPYRGDQDAHLAQQQAHRQQLLLNLQRTNAAATITTNQNILNNLVQGEETVVEDQIEESPTTSSHYPNNHNLINKQESTQHCDSIGQNINSSAQQLNPELPTNETHDPNGVTNDLQNPNNIPNPDISPTPPVPQPIVEESSRAATGFAGRLDIFNLNNIDWDRAVEDLTWENLLGLDGTFNFLEHALWIIVFNAIFIFFFAFLPYHYGKLFFKVTKFDKKIRATNFELFINTYFGYVLIAHLFYQLRSLAHRLNSNRFKLIFGLSYIIIKVALLIILEIVIFPFYCGWFLDICSLELFGSTFNDRMSTAVSNPFSSAIVHWLIGIVYVFYFASGVLLLRETLRPGLIWFLRGSTSPTPSSNETPLRTAPTDSPQSLPVTEDTPAEATAAAPSSTHPNINPNHTAEDIGGNTEFYPIREMIIYPVTHHLRRIILSWLLFFLVIVLSVHVPAKIIKWIVPTFLPYNFISSDSYFAELPLELILFHVVLPTLLTDTGIRAPRNFVTTLIRVWAEVVGEFLGIRSYLLGPSPRINNNTLPSNTNSNSTILISNSQHPSSQDLLIGQIQQEASSFSEYTISSSSSSSESSSSSTLSAATILPLVSQTADPLNSQTDVPEDKAATSTQDSSPPPPLHNYNYERPSYFPLRIFALLLVFGCTLVLLSLALFTVPVFIGRTLMNTLPINVIGILLFGDLDLFELNGRTAGLERSPPSRHSIAESVVSDNFIRTIYNPYSIQHFRDTATSPRFNSSFLRIGMNVSGSGDRRSTQQLLSPSINDEESSLDNFLITDFQDLYTALTGAYIMWLFWRYFNHNRRRLLTPRVPLPLLHVRDSSETPSLSSAFDVPFTSPLNSGLLHGNGNNQEPIIVAGSETQSGLMRFRGWEENIVGNFKIWIFSAFFKLFSTSKKVCEFFVIVGLLFVLIPLLAGILLDVCILVPFRVPSDRTPLIILSQDYLLGLLLVKLVVAASLILPTPIFLNPQFYNNGGRNRAPPPNRATLPRVPGANWWNYLNISYVITSPEIRRLNEEIAHFLSYGYQTFLGGTNLLPHEFHQNNSPNSNPLNLKEIWNNLIWPVIKVLGTALSMPYALVQIAGMIIGLSDIYKSRITRLIYPSILGTILVVSFLQYQLKQMQKFYQHIKDDRYLVGKQLVNLEKRPPFIKQDGESNQNIQESNTNLLT